MIDEIYKVIVQSLDLVSVGTHMTIFHQLYDIYNPDDTDVEVCIPVNKEFDSPPYQTRIVEGGLYISTIHIGSYDTIGNAYAALIRWSKQNNYSIIGPTVERYYKDGRQTITQDEFITEICIPVKHK
jgi:effector-binding domain-containing protein